MRVGPVAFLFIVAAGWAGLRAVMLWPESDYVQASPRRIAWQPALTAPSPAGGSARAMAGAVSLPIAVARTDRPTRSTSGTPADPTAPLPDRSEAATASAAVPRRFIAPSFPPGPTAARDRERLGLTVWTIVRGEAGPGLASAGQLGGSQAGVRARYDLGSGFAAAVRLSGPLRSPLGNEAAVALDWRPARRIPVTVSIERRAGLDGGGRDAFAAGVFGGGAVALPLQVRLDGYAQAGLVGAKRRDAYVDAAFRAERTLAGSARFRLAAGAGAWGGAQPGVSRLDLGPQLVAHAPVRNGSLRLAAEWRFRVAGRAQPGSGPALSIGADF
jgi:hypothetical protein